MSINYWNTKALAISIAEKRISPNEKFQYLLFSYCTFAFAGYIGWLFITSSSGLLFWFEGFLVLVVTYFGLLRCRDSYAGAPDDRLLENCIMLGFPLGLKMLLFTWIAHLSVVWGMQWIVSSLTLTIDSPIALVDFLLRAIYKFYPFLIITIATGIYYFRMSKHLQTIVERSGTAVTK